MMTTRHPRLFAAALIALTAGPLLAQERSAGGPPDDDAEIVVEAPRQLPPPTPPAGERSATTGAPLMTLTMRIPVLFGDLDLRRPEDAERLMTRIQNVAMFACGELDRAYPLTSDPDCVRHANATARDLAKAKIASISGK